MFWYFGLSEQIYSDLERKLQSQLVAELCSLWCVDQTHATLYHLQSNRVVERSNKVLEDALRVFLLNSIQGEWDLVIPQLMSAFRSTPHASTGTTANMLMLGHELQLPDLMMSNPYPETTRHIVCARNDRAPREGQYTAQGSANGH